jgi:hypothetical protein
MLTPSYRANQPCQHSPHRRPPHPRDRADAEAEQDLDAALTALRRGRLDVANYYFRRIAINGRYARTYGTEAPQ